MSNPKRKVALITGVTGQDGSYLAEFLLEKDYQVYGIIRRSSSFNTARVEHIYQHPRFKLVYGDMTDTANLMGIIAQVKPDEIYNLAAQSHVQVSFQMSMYSCDVDGMGALRLLEAVRACGLTNKVRIYQASTSELYGKVPEIGKPQNEKTPFYPRSPYAVGKLFAYWIMVNYREAYNMFTVNGILFNHESIRRGPTFVTRKISRAVVRIKKGIQDCLYLGNLDSKRDWGHAKDYVEAMWLMLQQEKPDDYCIATGETHSVREFCEKAFAVVGIKLQWKGKKGTVDEIGVDAETGKTIVRVDKRYFRPTEVDFLLGDPSKAEKVLGWRRKTSFDELVKGMVEGDMELLENEMKGKTFKVRKGDEEDYKE